MRKTKKQNLTLFSLPSQLKVLKLINGENLQEYSSISFSTAQTYPAYRLVPLTQGSEMYYS